LLASHLKGLDKPAMDELTSRLASLPAVPPLADSMKLERGESDWLIARIQSVPDDKLSDAFQPLVGIKMAPEVNQAISDAGGTRAGVVAALQNLQPYYDQLDELLRQNPSQSDFHTKSDDLRHSFADKPFARILLVNLGGAFDTDAAEQTQMVMLKAAITVVQNGPDKIKDVTDPINHDPLTYAESADGFDLTSTVIWASHPLVLKVGN
jgi:hypothetical protein